MSDLIVMCGRHYSATYHFVRDGKSLCGRIAAQWNRLDTSVEAARKSSWCCKQCWSALNAEESTDACPQCHGPVHESGFCPSCEEATV